MDFYRLNGGQERFGGSSAANTQPIFSNRVIKCENEDCEQQTWLHLVGRKFVTQAGGDCISAR
jgi:hypothetical protein